MTTNLINENIIETSFDIPILLVFFNRPDKFLKVFEKIRELKPTVIYLYQDGPRKNNLADITKISECRDILNLIDWNCTVYKYFQEENKGCNPSGYLAHTWLFSNEKYGIVLEDDIVADISFFYFCRELLLKYECDDRINMICGMSQFADNLSDNSYSFSRYCSIWGWASWARVVNSWDTSYSFLDNTELCKDINNRFVNKKEYLNFINTCRKHKISGVEHFESILWSNSFMNNRFTIIPSTNLVSNIGIGNDTVHSATDLRYLPRKVRKLFYMETKTLVFPLIHPKTITLDKNFEKKYYDSYFIIFLQRIEAIFLLFKYDGVQGVLEKIKYKANL